MNLKNVEQSIVNQYPLLGSSVDPNELSLTVKGLLISLVPIILAIMNLSGLNVTETLIMDLINNLFIAVSAIITLAGLIRKFKK